MQQGRESQTAVIVCMGRALAHGASGAARFSDPTALALLPPEARQRVERVRAGEAPKDLRERVKWSLLAKQSKMMIARTVAIDDAVRAGASRQVVILGAGLDGRAWRMPELAGVRVFEVDHPTTQGDKRVHISELSRPAGIIEFVSMDFERDSLDAVLKRAGHDRSSPTCWIWEGVVMYLARDVMRATLAGIARSSASGSTLIVNYHTLHRRFIARLMFRLIGEPQISAWTPDEMAADLRSAGFVVREDSSMADWNKRFAQNQAKVERAFYMRIANARN